MDDIWQREEIESPCVKICLIHPEARICTGCFRTVKEITDWSRLAPEERQQIMADLPGRAPALQKRRGGRAAKRARQQRGPHQG